MRLMGKISMVMFDLSGTTVQDDTGVRDCLYQAAVEFGLDTTPEEILLHMGTNKIHLYQFLIAREQGTKIDIKNLERIKDPGSYERAKEVFDRYQEIMIEHYRKNVQEVPGASEVFRWYGLGWLRDGLVDLSVDVEDIPGQIGRPAPFMIFHAMTQLNVQSVHEVIKVGDTPADMLEGRNAGCRGVIGVLSGPRPVTAWGKYWHTHVIPSVADLPDLIESEFL